jgi:hypothetical protein
LLSADDDEPGLPWILPYVQADRARELKEQMLAAGLPV